MRRLPGSVGGGGGFRPLLAALLALSSASSATASAHVDGTPPSRIAVVGAGIGGSAAAHFLRRHFGADVQLDVYEKGEVGGRLSTVTVNRERYESGGAVLHSLNLHMRDFVEQLGLKYRRGVSGKTAVFDGAEVILEETDWYLLDLFRLWWRYGISFIRLQMWVEEIMEKFVRIYKYQAHGYAFSSVEDLLDSLGGSGFLNMTRRPLSDSLLELGVSQRFIDEVVAPVIRLNYGQNVSVPAFVGAVSLAGAHSNLWAVEGGNKLVCEGLLKTANANLVPARVTSVRLLRSGDVLQYQLSVAGEEEAATAAYDAVVLAAPLGSGSGVSFLDFDPPLEPAQGDYYGMVATVVHGYLNTSLFGFPDPRLFPYAGVLTTAAPALFFNGVAAVYPVNVSLGFRRKGAHEAGVYKVFSPKVLTREQLKTLFRSYYSAQATEWQAYPRAGSTAAPVEMRPGLYYLNGVDRAGGAAEMSAVAAKNVALLAYHRWYGRSLQVDRKDLMHRIKTEL
ncbi:prenylcysteine oxidase-like isoform X2 [Syngnathoides biaculeatus]|uniref:prenylcysteine oxidase-like isoform X2 n=1 Tax=Syngnathoides biaculeatus TaxID=300417 RepID=UPI002ADE8EEB|nr:prenylcysteine oxidase-like isoform X2 [Syngnathoides biaculeatus]